MVAGIHLIADASGILAGMMDEFLGDLIPELLSRDAAAVADIAITAACVAAYKTNQSPRLVLDRLWKAMDDERYARQMKPCLEAVAHPTV